MPTLTQLLERGKDDAIGRNEVEVLVGSVAEMDRLVGVPTPTIDTILATSRLRARTAG